MSLDYAFRSEHCDVLSVISQDNKHLEEVSEESTFHASFLLLWMFSLWRIPSPSVLLQQNNIIVIGKLWGDSNLVGSLNVSK